MPLLLVAAERLRRPEPAERPQSQGLHLQMAEQIAWVLMVRMADQARDLAEKAEAADPAVMAVLTEATEQETLLAW